MKTPGNNLLVKYLLGSTVILSSAITANAQNIPDLESTGAFERGEMKRYVIQYKTGGQFAALAKMKESDGEVKAMSARQNILAATMLGEKAASLKGHPLIESIEEDPKRYLMAEETPYGIGMVQANQLSDSATGNQTVCIMDTGYDRQHVDLQSIRVTGNNSAQSGAWYNDGDGHGTHVAGTIAALGGNNEGVVGVIPGNNLNLHIIKVFNNNGEWAYGSDLALAVDQCIDAGATVISMSLGGEGSSSAEEAAFAKAEQAGIISVAAAGNDGITALNYPASYDSVISVAAVGSNGARPNWSQYNAQVELAAPGVNVKSTTPNNQYDSYSGTSMATPHVSGVAALVWSHYPDCTNTQIRAALNATAEDKGTAGRDNQYGYGIVKAKAAYDLLANGCDAAGSGGGSGGGGGGTTPPPPENNVLEKGVPVKNLSGARDEKHRFEIQIPAGATDVKFTMSGGSGDADLYVRKEKPPFRTNYECRPYLVGNDESCTMGTSNGETFHVMIYGYSAFSNVSIVATYNDGAVEPVNEKPVARWWYKCDGLACKFVANRSTDSDGEIVNYWWKFEDGKTGRGNPAYYTYGDAGSYRVTLAVRDDNGALGYLRRFITVSDISTSGVGVSAMQPDTDEGQDLELNWSGIRGEEVDIYMDGQLRDFTKNSGSWTDTDFARGASHKFKVCAYESSDLCSNEIKLKF